MASSAAGGQGGAEEPGTVVRGVGSEGLLRGSSGLLPPGHSCSAQAGYLSAF